MAVKNERCGFCNGFKCLCNNYPVKYVPPPPPKRSPKGQSINVDLPDTLDGLEFPFPIKTGLSLEQLGEVVCAPRYQSTRYVYPVGFKTRRSFRSYRDLETSVDYECSILRGKDAPIFRVMATDDPGDPAMAPTPSAAWQNIVERLIAKRIQAGDCHRATASISGPEMYGLSHPIVDHLIRMLPNADSSGVFDVRQPVPRARRAKKAKKKRPPDYSDDEGSDYTDPPPKKRKKSKTSLLPSPPPLPRRSKTPLLLPQPARPSSGPGDLSRANRVADAWNPALQKEEVEQELRELREENQQLRKEVKLLTARLESD